jgi:hypothetical protein
MLYKYLGPDRIDVLQNLRIRFTQPCGLNDPFESALLVRTDAFQAYEENLKRDAANLASASEEDRQLLEETKAELLERAKQAMAPHAVGRELADYLNRSQGVLSLSRTNDSLLMWAHYCNSHRGYVLALDDTHPWFYQKNGLGESTRPHNVIYTSRRIAVPEDADDLYDRLLCYKSLEWAYEQEVRIFRTFVSNDGPSSENDINKVHLFDIPKECIKEIYIGANADSSLFNAIFDSIFRKKLEVNIFVAYVDDERYGLNFRPIEEHSPD